MRQYTNHLPGLTMYLVVIYCSYHKRNVSQGIMYSNIQLYWQSFEMFVSQYWQVILALYPYLLLQ